MPRRRKANHPAAAVADDRLHGVAAITQVWLRWILLGIAVGVTVHVVRMRSDEPQT